MRVLLLPSAYHPAVGGVEVLTANLAKSLQRRGHEVEVWTYDRADSALTEVIEGVVVRRFQFQLAALNTLWSGAAPRMICTLRSMCAKAAGFRPDVLHVQCFSGNGAYATALAKLTRTPLVVTLQGETIMDDHQIYDRSLQLRMALRSGVRTAYATTACSRFTLDDAIRRIGARPKRTRVIYNGVDTNVVEEPVSLPCRSYFAALGRVVHNKGFDLLLAAFARYASGAGSTDLVIGGSGSHLETLRVQSQRLGIADRVHFVGPLRPGQVATFLRSAVALVVPSRVEPFGIVVLEGWRAGVPVIATSSGGPPEFVTHGETGFVVDPNDTPALSDILSKLDGDPSLRRRIGASGQGRVTDFSWAAITEQYEAVYRDAICDSPASRRYPGAE